MAVIDGVPGLEVHVVVDNQSLQEHQDRDAKVSGNTVERYIEAQSNAEYEIHYSFQAPFPNDRVVSMIVTIDGKNVDTPMIRPFELFDPKGHISHGPISRQGMRWLVQSYSFSAIDVREATVETVPEDLKAKLKPVGIITCAFYFLNNPRRNTHLHGTEKNLEELPTVSEKAIKGDALSHQTILSDIKPTEEVEYFDADYADNGKPFATFHFYYRSLTALKDLHIIPRTPSPTASDLDQLDREQLESMVRRFRDQRARTKRERSQSVTVVGNEEDVGDCDPDVVEISCVDLRAQRKKMRVRQVPALGTEVIEVED